MGDDFVKTEKLVEKYLNNIEKKITDAFYGFKKEGVLTKKFTESFMKKATERVKQACERYESRHRPNLPVSNETVSGQMNSSNRSNPAKRKLETTESDRSKKQKSSEPTSSDDKLDPIALIKQEKKPTVGPSNENTEYLVLKNESETVVSNTDISNPDKESSSQGIRGASTELGRSIVQNHLIEQLERANQIFITIPDRLISTEQSRREIFHKICERLNVNVSFDQIENTNREDNALIVKFRDIKVKEMIMESADGKKVWLDHIINGEKSWRIHVRHYLTRYYSKLYGAAQEYKETRFLHSFKLTDEGLVVKRKESSKGIVVLSMRELNEYVTMK
ncbi:uncharacterized protein LOC129568084 [Sitodiplosis mosellana]|uniref:uncharacterized protein LOC129568084 n=1 Tax=Sitodiplosis mosellana TaxID=263140 RepID=UPI002443BFFF|nr:uncharacterized protein LOC129568084 [Sitodiplosis mosellana]